MNSFNRTRLRHGMPPWVKDGATYFITINSRIRGENQLANPEIAHAIKEAIDHYTRIDKWYPILVVIMPDHLHMLLSLNTAQFKISQLISPWKGYLAKTQNIDWQDGFFEHRIRSQDSLEEKASYIHLNPVRAGLVKQADQWPYTWDQSDFEQ